MLFRSGASSKDRYTLLDLNEIISSYNNGEGKWNKAKYDLAVTEKNRIEKIVGPEIDNTKKEDDNSKNDSNILINNNVMQVSSTEENYDETEKKLEDILATIDGVGKVKVMITYSSSSTFIPIYDENNKISNTTESDDSGGTRTIVENDEQKSIVYKENSDGTKEPITKNIESPKMEGAIITATGANNSEVKEKIISAVEAATGLATHKIQVFKIDEN